MKSRLPILATPAVPARERQPRRATPIPSQRVAASRPLVCVAGEAGEERSTRLAVRLIEILCGRGCTLAALVVSDGGAAARSAAEALRNAGAGHVALVPEGDLPDAVQRALDAQAAHTVFVALGATLTEHLQPLLTIAVSGRYRAAEGGLDLVDLRLEGDPDGVATRVGDWLAQRVDRHASEGESRGLG